jgi:hypothetical protein
MRYRVYKVVCKNVANEFIHGKISGILYALSGKPIYGERKTFAIVRVADKVIFKVYTTKRRYLLMRKHIETLYPEKCEFDI